ncbi:cation-transporting P-type ATPase [Solirubrobacter ginsenosidimutans]|uniref:Cation-transporting P-type ATPase n=1 Tax=Solirubrobacter ginsenosidimutans TaxID=490573 RepID=A0A9X3MNM4_9ACTN|nr:cation transporting ATPase C-terminal domain-containing protein [Solirubrobacter ginsenosidimutans]MDA0158936.1 cation-transporting P-type ATPase [Solirubrobacter ginsenosidimutans]
MGDAIVAAHVDPDVANEPPAWHALPGADVLRAFHVDPRVGLTSQEAAQRRAVFGPNAPAAAEREPRRWAFTRQYMEPMPLLLAAASIGCFVLGEPLTGFVVLAVSLVHAVLGVRSEGEPSDAGSALQRLFPASASVRRDGRTLRVPARELVPGDVLLVEAGEPVAADGRLLESFTLEVDESALTGERVPARKGVDLVIDTDASLAERTDMLYLGTRVTHGTGELVVTATGLATEAGRISELLAAPGEVAAAITSGPPWLMRRSLIFGGVALILMVALGLLRAEDADSIALAAVALTVGALPIGLPVVVAVIVARAAKLLERAGAVVRRAPALTALGSMSALNVGASGVLTHGRPAAVELVLPRRRYSTAGTIKHVAGDPELALEPVLTGLALSTGAVISDGELTGDPVEGALVALAEKGGVDVAVTRSRWPRVAEAPYDATHGLMATFHRMSDESGTTVVRCFARGTPDSLLGRAVTEQGPGPRPLRIDARARERYLTESAELADRGLQVVAFGHRDFADTGFEVPANALTIVDGLTLLALVGIADPPREGARAAVASAKAAGVRVRLVTGRPVPVAEALARSVAIEGRTITGTALAAISDRELAGELDRIGVLAGATPAQRVRLVAGLERAGHVVGVAGRGLDDAPAVRAADIGMATAGDRTDVSRAVAAVTLTGDVTTWMAAVIGGGRGAYDDLVRYTRLESGVLIGTILTFAGASVLAVAGGMPFLPIQVLYGGLTAQLAQGIALGWRGHDRVDATPRPPVPSAPGYSRIAPVAAVQAAVTLGVIALAEGNWGTPVARTMGLATFAFTTVALSFSARAERTPVRPLLLAAAVSIGAIVLGVEARLTQMVLETEGLRAGQWAICAGAAFPFLLAATRR